MQIGNHKALTYDQKKMIYGAYVVLENKKSVSTKKVSIVKHANGYANIPFD